MGTCPNVIGKAFSLSSLIMMLAVGLSYMAFIMLRYITSIHNFLSFYHMTFIFHPIKVLYLIY